MLYTISIDRRITPNMINFCHLRLLFMPAQIIQTMTFTQIMDIWRPGRSLEDHLKMSKNLENFSRSLLWKLTVYANRIFSVQ